MKFQVEHTDTFGGEANYCWVRRYIIEADDSISDLALVRRAKQYCGLSGCRSKTENWGDMLVIKPAKIHQIIFVTPIEEEGT